MSKKKIKKTKTDSKDSKNSKKNIYEKIGKYYQKNFKKLLIIPSIIFLFAIFSIILTINNEGTPITEISH